MAKLKNLENKVVWITGASSGLGKALARECALQGAQVVLTSRRYDELEAVRVGLFKPECHVSIAADITDEAQVRHAHEQVLACKGRIDWLINNAGLSQRALTQDTTMQTERAIMEVDYFSQVFFTKTVLPTFLKQKSGRVVFVSSVAVGTPLPNSFALKADYRLLNIQGNVVFYLVSKDGVEVLSIVSSKERFRSLFSHS